MNELKSYTEYAVSTPTADFVIGFDFNYGEDAVNVTVDDVPATEAGYTVVYLNETTIRLSPSVPSGVVRLQRETDIDQTDHAYRAGAKFIAQTMDENFEQLRHSQQEVRDGFVKLADDTYEIIDTLEEVGKSAQDAADAAEVAAELANNAAAQVNDKVSYEDFNNKPHNAMLARDAASAHPTSSILDASGETQQQVNYNGGSKWHSRVGSYLKNERVVLANGDIVKSTVDGNTNDPNVVMVGWLGVGNDSVVESIADLLAIATPSDGARLFVKSYNTPNYPLNNPYCGGGWFIYDESKSSLNDGVLTFNGWVRQFDGFACISPEMAGASLNESDDVTTAVQRCLSQNKYPVFFNSRTYLVGELNPVNGCHLTGFAGVGYTADEPQSRPRLLMKAGARALLNVDKVRGLNIYGLLLDGFDKSAPVITSGSVRLTATNCRIINGSVGVGGSFDGVSTGYTRVIHLIKCVIASNVTGLMNTIDSFFTAVELANNYTNLRMQGGSNSNTFNGGRIEWAQGDANTGFNIYLVGASGAKVSDWQFTGTLIDRGLKGSIQLLHANNIQFSACRIRRGNSSANGETRYNNNIYLESTSGCSFVNCTQSTGANDGGGGNTTPEYAFSFGTGNSNVSIIGGNIASDFVGATRGLSAVTEVKIMGVTGAEDYIKTAKGLDLASGVYSLTTTNLNPAALTTTTARMATKQSLGTYTFNQFVLEIKARNTATNVMAVFRYSLMLSRLSGTATVTTKLINEIAPAALLGFDDTSQLRLSISNVAEDGSAFDISCNNTTANNYVSAWTLKT